MKKALPALFFLFLCAFVPQVGYGQESEPAHNNGTLDGQHHETSLQEGEPAPAKLNHSKPDSIAVRPIIKLKSAPEKAVDKKAEDAEPFNFLYYIIQRFKSSDIIED